MLGTGVKKISRLSSTYRMKRLQRQSVMTDEYVQSIKKAIHWRQCFTNESISEVAHEFSQSDAYTIVINRCDVLKTQRKASALTFVYHYHTEGNKFLVHTVTD